MIFKCVIETSEIPDGCSKITPVYKSLNDDLTNEIEWIHQHEIINAVCEYIYDLYCESFKEKKVLTRNSFYKLVRKELPLKSKAIRIGQDNVKRCFVEK